MCSCFTAPSSVNRMGKAKQKHVPGSFKQKHPKNKKNKSVLVFDEKAREEFLTGFRKRKNERRKRAQEEIIKRLKEEKTRVKQKRKDAMLEQRGKKGQQAPDPQEIVPPTVFELESHVVTVADVADVDFVGHQGVMLGANQAADPGEEAEVAAAEDGSGDGDGKEADDDGEQKREKTGVKRKWKHKRHTNFSHAAHKTSKLDKAGRQRLKRKNKRN